MNSIVDKLKGMRRAMQPYVYMIYEIVYESNAQNILSIGVRQAQAERTILAALHEKGSGKLTSIDLYDRTDRITNTFPELLPFWNLIVGNSHSQETLNKIKDEKYDIILIDGDHSYQGFKQDYEMYFSLLKEGGYLLCHDTHNPNEGCSEYWKTIEAKSKLELNYGFAGFGIIQKL